MQTPEAPQDQLSGLAKKMQQLRGITTDLRVVVLELVVVIGVIEKLI